jgi:phage/conjugal plasmid C-4 type zinc finger TraR family protein
MDEADRTQAISEVYENAAMQNLANRRVFQPVAGGRARQTCEDCGRPIPQGRLKANPHAIRCIPCQIILERGGNA